MSNKAAMEPTDVGRMQPLAPPKLPYFAGDPADGPAEDFVAEVDRVLAAYPMSDEMAAHFIYSHLKGAAHTEVKLHSWEETNSPRKVTGILTRVFGDKRRLPDLLLAFFMRNQQPSEEILDYSHALRSLEVSIRRKDSGALSDNIVRDKFVEGLASPVLKKEMRHFVGRHPQITFLEVRTEALQMMRDLEELQEDYHQLIRKETLELEKEVFVLKKNIETLTETIIVIASSQLGTIGQSQGKRKRRRRRRRNKKQAQAQVSTDTESKTGTGVESNLSGCQKQISSVLASPCTVQTRDEDEEPCYSYGGWVLLPTPPDTGTNHSSQEPGKSSRGQKKRSPATEETESQQVLRSPRQQGVGRSRTHVSHSMRIVPGNATQIKHAKHGHRGREIKWA